MANKIDYTKPYEDWAQPVDGDVPSKRTKTHIFYLIVSILVLACAVLLFLINSDENPIWDKGIPQSIGLFLLGQSVVGSMVIWFSTRKRPTNSFLQSVGLWLIVAALMIFVFIWPLFLYCNSKFDYHPKREIPAKVLIKEEFPGYRGGTNYSITFLVQNSEQDMRAVGVSPKTYKTVSENDSVRLRIGSGLFGIEYLYQVIKLP